MTQPTFIDYFIGGMTELADSMDRGIVRLQSIRSRAEAEGFQQDDLEWVDTQIENLRQMWTTFSVAADSVEHEGHNHEHDHSA